MSEYDHVEGLLIQWGYRLRVEDDPGLGFKPQPLARMYAKGTVYVQKDPCKIEEVDRVCEVVNKLAMRPGKLDVVRALKARYVLLGVPERRLATKLMCTRYYFRKCLNEGKEWVARHI